MVMMYQSAFQVLEEEQILFTHIDNAPWLEEIEMVSKNMDKWTTLN